MVEKRIQGHDFENGGPIRQYELNFQEGANLWVNYNGDFTVTFNNEYTTTNTIILGSDTVIDNPQINNTTYVQNLVVTENMNYPAQEGDMRFNIEQQRMMYYINDTWNFIEQNYHVTTDGYRRLDTLIPVRGESRWVRFKKWVSNIFSR
jgi:hypothetical protein